MIEFIPAKINLGLYVTGKRTNGYHTLETVFYPIGLSCGTPENPAPFGDILEVIPAQDETDSLVLTGNGVDCPPEKNLCMKALSVFRETLAEKNGRLVEPLRIILEKHIPSGAGLGGGSADATFTLLMLNKLYGNPFDTAELERMALSLGADCPFFVRNVPALGKGIGEILSDFPISLKGKWLGLAKPEKGISTREAFAGISCSPAPENYPDILQLPPAEWKNKVKNVFEDSFFAIFPEGKSIKENLYSHGAEYASLSGSGSTFFGIFPDPSSALKAVNSTGTPYISVLPCER